jgi:hypothetical protein
LPGVSGGEEVIDLPPSYSTLQLYPDEDDGLPAFVEIFNPPGPRQYWMGRAASVEDKDDWRLKRYKFERQMKMFRSVDF